MSSDSPDKLPPLRDDFNESDDELNQPFRENLFESPSPSPDTDDGNPGEAVKAIPFESFDQLPSRQALPAGLEFIRENLECLAVAFFMALVIRHYVFEPFQIPTGSMATTLLGKHRMYECEHCDWDWAQSLTAYNDPRSCPHCLQTVTQKPKKVWSGEKILANKMVYRFRQPQRWESAVFRPTHKKHLNFIKRIVGMGGETVSIVNGDIHINGQVSAKPRLVQDQVWIPVYDSAHDIKGTNFFKLGDGWHRRLDDQGRLQKYEYVDLHDRLSHDLRWFRGSGRLGQDDVIWNRLPYNSSGSGGAAHPVGDLRVDVEVTMASSKGLFSVVIEDGLQKFRLDLGSTSQLIHLEGNTELRVVPLQVVLPEGRPVWVSLSNWDNHVLVQFDGQDVFEGSFESLSGDSSQGAGTYRLVAKDSSMAVTHIRVWRDIYYTTGRSRRHEWEIPEGHYFMLGDNANSSSDSREWGHPAVPLSNFKGRPWVRSLHIDLPFTGLRWDWVKFGEVE